MSYILADGMTLVLRLCTPHTWAGYPVDSGCKPSNSFKFLANLKAPVSWSSVQVDAVSCSISSEDGENLELEGAEILKESLL